MVHSYRAGSVGCTTRDSDPHGCPSRSCPRSARLPRGVHGCLPGRRAPGARGRAGLRSPSEDGGREEVDETHPGGVPAPPPDPAAAHWPRAAPRPAPAAARSAQPGARLGPLAHSHAPTGPRSSHSPWLSRRPVYPDRPGRATPTPPSLPNHPGKPRPRPVTQPTATGHARAIAELLGQIDPADTGEQHEQDAVEARLIVQRDTAGLPRPPRSDREQRLNARPRLVADLMPRHAAPAR